ncbi:MAG: hypothetical protein D6732_22860 [Methanobacteriota archaeon]|nr:MAG: hypothetical protein D6732_22860 [Euryarchaeota archaeon]
MALIPYISDKVFSNYTIDRSFRGEGYEFQIELGNQGFRIIVRKGLFYIEKGWVKFFVILYLQILFYGLMGLVFQQRDIQGILYYLVLSSPILTYIYLFGYLKYKFVENFGLPQIISDQVFIHKDAKSHALGFNLDQNTKVYRGCTGFFLLVSSTGEIMKQLTRQNLKIKSELGFREYMQHFDSHMTHFSLVILDKNGQIYPVGDPHINPMTDGLIEAINYITDRLPIFQQVNKFKKVFRVNESTFLTDIYFEFYKNGENPYL